MTEADAGVLGQGPPPGESEEAAPAKVDRIWVVMAVLVCVDFLLGIGAIVAVPFGRATEWLPVKGRGLYVVHAIVGALLGIGAVFLLARFGTSAQRITRLAARWGIAGIVLGVAGGLLAVSHPLRLVGMGLMLVGGLVAVVGYCMPSLEAHDRKERAALQARLDQGAVQEPLG